MIHLTYSNRTEELLAGFVGRTAAERERRGPYAPLRLVVPNRNVETYVKFGLAQALGIAANIEVSFLRRLLSDLTAQVVPDGRLVDAAEMEGHLLALLHDPAFLAASELGPVRDYLGAAGDSADALDRRRCQLAAELATLFDEYAASRPEMLRAWRERLTLADHPNLAGAERWQRALWLALFGGPAGTGLAAGRVAAHAAASGYTAVTLADLVRVLERLPEESARGLAPLHVFGVSYIARGFHAVLAALARHTDVHVYTLNPCREFWEDLETTGESRRRRKRGKEIEAMFPLRAQASQPGLALGDDPFALLDERENLALRLWGRPGRENIRVLNQQGGGDFEGRFISGAQRGAATLLSRLQDDILDRVVPAGPDAALAVDGSLRVLPCPGVRRELEVVAAEIWRLLEEHPDLRLNQIAVVVPEAVKDTYLSHVAAVFGEAHQLPHSIVDLSLSASHRLGDAAIALLNVPLVAATRRELLPVLTHPALMGRFPDASPADWLRLAEDLGIVHGADRQDHQGTYIERDVLNWDQGIRRVVLGSLMEAGGAADEAPVTLGGQQYLPLGRAADEQPGALAFALLARSLLADARFLSGATGPRLRPLREWAELIRALLTGYLVPADDNEEAQLARCLTEVDALDLVPLGDTPVSYRVAATLVERALGRMGGASGQYLARGVTVTSFVPMRAIPFRVVFVVGLGQAQFPRNGRAGELDLRAARRQLGDVSPREQDLYMFLETLLSTRDRLVLSYVARDELSGAPLAPSSVLLELRDLLAAGYLPPAEVQKLFAPDDRPPLRRYDDVTRLRAGTLAHREAGAKRLGQSLRAALPAGAAVPDLPALRRTLDQDRLDPLARRLGVNGPPAAAGRSVLAGLAPGERLVVPLSAIRQFLEDPLQGSARFRLRLREVEGDEELIDREQEAFVTDRPLRAGLLREIMQRVVAAGEPTWEAIEATLASVARREELRGSAPTGFFAAAERPALVQILQGWQQQLAEWAGGQPLGGRLIRFGRPGPRERLPGERRDPILLTLPGGELGLGRELEVELTGSTDLMIGPLGAAASALFSCRSFIGDNARHHRDRLRAFVDHLALTAAGEPEAPHGSVVVWAKPGESSLIPGRFRPLPGIEARRYLGAMVADMVTGAHDSGGQPTGVHPYLLPCEGVFNARTRKGAGSLVEEIEKLRDAYLERPILTFSSAIGPVPEAVERHDPPGAEEAARMAARRFDLYFDLWEDKSS